MVDSPLKDDVALDMVFGVQWSWSEPEEKSEQLRSLADCVSRRLDQGNRNVLLCVVRLNDRFS